jgi:hypothetical protein
MDDANELKVPNVTDEEAQADPIVAKLANVIGALAAAEAFMSPTRFEKTMSAAEAIGKLLGEPSLTRVLVLRTLSSPPRLRTALAKLKLTASNLPAPQRADLMHALVALVEGDDDPSLPGLIQNLANAFSLPAPSHSTNGESSVFDALGSLVISLVHPETRLIAEAREFATDFGEAELFAASVTAWQTGDQSIIIRALGLAVDSVRKRCAAASRAAEAQAEALSIARELDDAADQMEQVARQRYAALTRRATVLKRHIREDLNALAEDAAEEFEVDFRRLAEKNTGWFGKLDSADLNDRSVKNLERRYRNLSRRYQDQLDLLHTEVFEFCDEFTHAGDEALRPIARHEFRAVAPHPSLELRVKAAVDRATTRTLVGGAAGAAASGAAVHVGLLSGAAIAGAVATPVGVVVLGAVALAGMWKLFATPSERRKRDPRERARELDDKLRQQITANLPCFDQAVDAVLTQFQEVAVPDIFGPRVEAARIREIASAHRTIARRVVEEANGRIERLIRVSQTG